MLREEEGLDHEDAIRDTIVSVLMSPHFCYHLDFVESAGVGTADLQVSPTNV
jgi:hypothetical protein